MRVRRVGLQLSQSKLCSRNLLFSLYFRLYAVTEEEEASLDTGAIKNKNCMCIDGCEQDVHLPSLSVCLSICVEQRGTVEQSSSSVQERGGLEACFSSQVRCD